MLSLFGAFITVIALIFGYIVSYHVVIAAAPDYVSLWWASFWLALVGGIFSGLAKYYND